MLNIFKLSKRVAALEQELRGMKVEREEQERKEIEKARQWNNFLAYTGEKQHED